MQKHGLIPEFDPAMHTPLASDTMALYIHAMQPRSFITIAGDDRIHFLQGILTQDIARLADEKIQFAALLSPQGKLLHDMFLIEQGDTILLDTASAYAPMLLKRLMMYKLRAKVTITDTTADWHLTFGNGLPDPRHPELPHRHYSHQPGMMGIADDGARIALAIPEFGIDIAPDTITAMDAGYDLLNAISFTKGCYVGQEVTARMHYKAIARKGFFRIASAAPLTPGTPILHADRTLGTVTSADADGSIAFLKFEDAHLLAVTPDGAAVAIRAPGWMQPKLALFETDAGKQ